MSISTAIKNAIVMDDRQHPSRRVTIKTFPFLRSTSKKNIRPHTGRLPGIITQTGQIDTSLSNPSRINSVDHLTQKPSGREISFTVGALTPRCMTAGRETLRSGWTPHRLPSSVPACAAKIRDG